MGLRRHVRGRDVVLRVPLCREGGEGDFDPMDDILLGGVSGGESPPLSHCIAWTWVYDRERATLSTSVVKLGAHLKIADEAFPRVAVLLGQRHEQK